MFDNMVIGEFKIDYYYNNNLNYNFNNCSYLLLYYTGSISF